MMCLRRKRDKEFLIILVTFSTIVFVQFISTTYFRNSAIGAIRSNTGRSASSSSSSSASSNSNHDKEDQQRHRLIATQEDSYENDEMLLKRKKNRQYSSSKSTKAIQLERGSEIKDRYNKAILVENNILPINEYEERLNMNNKGLRNKNVANGNKRESIIKSKNPNDKKFSSLSILKLDPKEILRKGPSFESLHSWSHYLNAFIYDHGIPRQVGAINYHYNNGTKGVYVGYRYEPPDISRWDTNVSHWERDGRFPTVEERIKYYMGDYWYNMKPNNQLFSNINETCTNTSSDLLTPDFYHTIFASPYNLSPEKLFRIAFYKPNKSYKKKLQKKQITIPLQRNAQYYTRDIIDLAILSKKKGSSSSSSTTTPPPVLLHFGDGPSKANKCFNTSYPVFSKVRDLVAENDPQHCRYYSKSGNCNKQTHSNIIWPMNRGRHFRPMASVPLFDIPWRNKKSKLIWRGRALCDEEKSMNSIHSVDFFSCDQRMSLVRNHLKSKDLVDAKFHMPKKAQPKDMPQDYFGDKLDMEGMLQYKYQLAVEGTDISSGLKWMLFSNSIVFMPTPTYSSYAMETLLQPFVHYIPVKADMSNVEEMVQWCENHPDQAMHIAERSTLFMYDLFFHPDAYQDEQDVLTGIVERYQQLFQTYNE